MFLPGRLVAKCARELILHSSGAIDIGALRLGATNHAVRRTGSGALTSSDGFGDFRMRKSIHTTHVRLFPTNFLSTICEVIRDFRTVIGVRSKVLTVSH